jgi:aryl-alcohol dehydrogenase-like predicted oxidoreductase
MRELGVGLVPYSPLGRGFLTGTVDVNSLEAGDARNRLPRFATDANQAIADVVRSVAEGNGGRPRDPRPAGRPGGRRPLLKTRP